MGSRSEENRNSMSYYAYGNGPSLAEREKPTEVQLLREAFQAARSYIHGGQDRGVESERRYLRWFRAKEAIEAHWNHQ